MRSLRRTRSAREPLQNSERHEREVPTVDESKARAPRAEPTSKLVSMRDAFGKGLVDAGRRNDRIVVLDADLASSTRTSMFADEIPERFIQVGIAEQNMVGLAAGLSTVGYIPFACTFAVFMSKRACEQVSTSVAYPRLNVKLVGAYSGLYTGKTGATHQSLEDIAIMRAIPNIVVVVPADAVQLSKALDAIVEYDGPVYLRVARDAYPVIFDESYRFELGKAVVLREGNDASIVAAGIMTQTALYAAEQLAREGLQLRVVNVSTIKPIDREAICKAARETGAIVTVENHSIIGGLASSVAEVVTEECPVPVEKVGVTDVFGESGSNEDLTVKYGLSVDSVVEAVSRVLAKKRLGLGRRHSTG